MERENKFSYKYTAPTEEERKEIASIRKQYEAQAENGDGKLERLRALHARVKNVANALSLSVGICGLLVFGLGMSMILEWSLLFGGIAVGVVGGAAMGLALPLYRFALARNKRKYGEEILRLSKELLAEND